MPTPIAGRSTSVRAAIAIAVLAGMALLVGLVWLMTEEGPTPPEAATMVLSETDFGQLDGWEADDHAQALAAMRQSCKILKRVPADRALRGDPQLGMTAGDLHPVCDLAEKTADQDAKTFFENAFIPFHVRNGSENTGLMTGYYEPEMKGSRTKSEAYPASVLARPDNLVMVELGDFRDSLRGQRIAGHVENGRLRPFADRTQIVEGALDEEGLELIWLPSAIDAFFLEIQGSGRVVLQDGPDAGQVIRLSYAGQNGHPYTAIGRPLIDRGHIPREEMSMAAIRTWLENNPDEAQEVMNLNASFVFFTELVVEHPELGPPGAQSALLTPHRSIAVDRKHHALGLPFWFELPSASAASPDGPIRRLMMAQDTGGAIRGPVRADYFAGVGEQAGDIAGQMQDRGSLTMLLPHAVAERARKITW
ncbi:Peptidoglycan lytic transglycosylase/GH102 [Candidatus Phaeomarinobacter ectocarpi]|uniref:peptidoglycan lytic exotransglycosylase n=1 Tax=Candidatus Phaeomarinibacter ectocarpi TaxID=1458461 RepID=X5MLU3_9HYPH|nr:MltA domain-containing protein [Candidatus Phaeomarinobacter ectocarpi]CDO59785.1 Peptidoglycan lytic transglycosylase/GH102 [Candidatus Phaeomarinobacter ectocarpi]